MFEVTNLRKKITSGVISRRLWVRFPFSQLKYADVPVDAYIIYACSGKFKTWVRIPPSVLGVYTVEFSLREECTEHLKDRVQGVKSFFQFKARKTGVWERWLSDNLHP